MFKGILSADTLFFSFYKKNDRFYVKLFGNQIICLLNNRHLARIGFRDAV